MLAWKWIQFKKKRPGIIKQLLKKALFTIKADMFSSSWNNVEAVKKGLVGFLWNNIKLNRLSDIYLQHNHTHGFTHRFVCQSINGRRRSHYLHYILLLSLNNFYMVKYQILFFLASSDILLLLSYWLIILLPLCPWYTIGQSQVGSSKCLVQEKSILRHKHVFRVT